jgi:hypothetical protein
MRIFTLETKARPKAAGDDAQHVGRAPGESGEGRDFEWEAADFFLMQSEHTRDEDRSDDAD